MNREILESGMGVACPDCGRKLIKVTKAHEHKLRKPDPESYRAALRRFGLVAEEAVFVDDSPANVAAADALGIASIQFRDAPTLRRDLKRVGVL